MLYRRIQIRSVFALLCTAALTLFAMSAQADPAAHLEFVSGKAIVVDLHNQTRLAEKGMGLQQGDTVVTNDGRVQIRFSDGAYFSLQPQTRFRIDEYHYSDTHDDGDRIFLSLLKGSLRTISGLIGKRNRAAYRMSTTVATIGIRGTEYVLDLNSSLYGHVAQGAIEVCNGAGCLTVPGGQAFFVASPSTLPVFTEKRAVLSPAGRPVAASTSFNKAGNDPSALSSGAEASAKTRDRIPTASDFTLSESVVDSSGDSHGNSRGAGGVGAQVRQSVGGVGNAVGGQGRSGNSVAAQASAGSAVNGGTTPNGNAFAKPDSPPGTAVSNTNPGLGNSGSPPGLGNGGSPPGLSNSGSPPGLGNGGSPPGLGNSGSPPGLGNGGSPPGLSNSGSPPGLGNSGSPRGLGNGGSPPGLGNGGSPPGLGNSGSPPGLGNGSLRGVGNGGNFPGVLNGVSNGLPR